MPPGDDVRDDIRDPSQTIAELRRELARYRAERDEALARESAVAEVLQVINASPGDLAPVFDAILEKAHALCGIAFGSLQIYEEGKVHAVAVRAIAEDLAELLRQPFEPRPGSAPSRLVTGERFVHNTDIVELAKRFPDDPRIQLSAARGLRTGLFVPLRKEGDFLGYISAFRDELRPFSEKEIALLENFAAQAVIAMENARLITETREALEQQTATAEVLGVINSSPGDLGPVFAAMLQKATRLCDAAFGVLHVFDGVLFHQVAMQDVPSALAEALREPREPVPGSIGDRMLRGTNVISVPDILEDEAYRARTVPFVQVIAELGGGRSYVAVALRKEDQLLGIFAIFRQEVRPFTDKQIALLQNFAAQAVIAMENARLITETREALEQQTATAEVLGVINASPGDLAPVFDAMLERALRLGEAAHGHLTVYDGETFRTAAVQGKQELVDWFRQRVPWRAGPGTTMERIVRGERIVHVADVMDDDAYRQGNPVRRALVEIGACRTMLSVALQRDGALLGAFTVYRQEVRPFSDKQISLLQNFAAQAVIAIENARLITETREALEQQTATAEVLGVINSSPGDLAPVFDAMLEKAACLCETAFGVFHSFDGEAFHTIALRGAPPELVDFYRKPLRPYPGAYADQIVRGAALVSADDLSQDEIYRSGPGIRAVVDFGGGRSFVGIALRKDDKLLGAFWMYRQEVRPFTDKQIALLQNFAAQAVIAMENARLITETREALEQQTATAEVLGVINSSPGNLAPVFDAILEKAHRLCGAEFGHLSLYDGEMFRAAAVRTPPGAAAMADGLRRGFRGSEAPVSRPLLDGAGFVQIQDLAQVDHPLARAANEAAGIRTLLAVPLRRDDTLLGMIVAARQEVRPFTDKQIALLQNFAAQAVIAMENARLITETREALEQQTATADVLGVINASPGDLAPVFDAMLEKATRLSDAAFGVLWNHETGLFRAAALRGVPPGYAEFVAREPRGSRPGGALQRLVDGEPLVHIPDADIASGDATARALVELGGIKTLLAVPLRKDDALLGAFTIYRQEVRRFTDQQIALLQNFAAQAVIAMENARLITETREALEQQTATAEVLGVINSSPGDLSPVFNEILEKAMRLCEAAHGHLWTFDRELGHPVAVRGEPGFVQWLSDRGAIRPDPVSPAGRILRGEPAVQVGDITADESYRREGRFREFVDAGGIRTMLNVALVSEGTVLGMIAIYRKEVRPFTDKQIALLQNFAAQAVIAMENARLITETREALEQQTATAEVLGVINASPGDLTPVFDAIVQKAMHLCDAAFGYMVIRDGDAFRTVATLRVPAEYAEFRRRNPVQPGQPGIAARIRAGEPFVHMLDLKDDDLYRDGDAQRRAMVDLGGARSGLTVALKKGGEAVGTIDVYRQEVRPFTDKQIALLQNFAAQAVIAMENARLITETREALEQQTATAEVLGVINASPGDLTPVFDAILEKALSLCEGAFGSLARFDGEAFDWVATRGVPEAWFGEFAALRYRPTPGLALYRFQHGDDDIEHVVDIAADETGRSAIPDRRRFAELTGARTAIWIALRKDRALRGALVIYRREVRPFTDKQIALLQNFAAQAVIAMENARLLGELRQRTDEIAEINRELEARVASQLAELERTGKLRRFLAPQLADLIVAQGDESILETHRREIVVVFCDVRGFTGFAERAEPEEVMAFLRDYHAALGPIVARFEGTLDHYAGDGIMVFFNDPLPTPDPANRAIEMAAAMREAAQPVLRSWRRHGFDLGFGVGISQGYATLGQIGFAERMDYTAIGTVCNLAARLCGEAKDGQILISRRVAVAVEDAVRLEELGEVSLRGLSQPVAIYNVAERGGDGLTAARGVT